jgi:hypothetical protein|tara:strand:+ start:416 stop:550 length:135 start_codon:yes stop_codon:yes gene_type:complete
MDPKKKEKKMIKRQTKKSDKEYYWNLTIDSDEEIDSKPKVIRYK